MSEPASPDLSSEDPFAFEWGLFVRVGYLRKWDEADTPRNEAAVRDARLRLGLDYASWTFFGEGAFEIVTSDFKDFDSQLLLKDLWVQREILHSESEFGSRSLKFKLGRIKPPSVPSLARPAEERWFVELPGILAALDGDPPNLLTANPGRSLGLALIADLESALQITAGVGTGPWTEAFESNGVSAYGGLVLLPGRPVEFGANFFYTKTHGKELAVYDRYSNPIYKSASGYVTIRWKTTEVNLELVRNKSHGFVITTGIGTMRYHIREFGVDLSYRLEYNHDGDYDVTTHSVAALWALPIAPVRLGFNATRSVVNPDPHDAMKATRLWLFAQLSL